MSLMFHGFDFDHQSVRIDQLSVSSERNLIFALMKDIYDDIAEEVCSSLSTGDEELNIELEILDHLNERQIDFRHTAHKHGPIVHFGVDVNRVV